VRGKQSVTQKDAIAAASTIAKFVHAGHPIARATGHIGGGTSQPSFKFTKRLKVARTAAGTNNEYIVILPSAANDATDVRIKNLAAGATIANVDTTPDATYVAPGSLFPTASFGTGSLEARFLGMEVKITPVGARLAMEGVASQVIGTEDLFVSSDVIDTLIATDRRSKFVPKRPGRPMRFNYVHQDSETHGKYWSNGTYAFGVGATNAIMVLSIPPDGTNPVQYLLEVVEHWEAIGTTVIGNVTSNYHNSPLYEKIHHAAASLHTAKGSVHTHPEQDADSISRSIFGRGWDWLTKTATGLANDISSGARAAGSIKGAYNDVKALVGPIETGVRTTMPIIEELGPELAMIAL
jgi:hypothetical protein